MELYKTAAAAAIREAGSELSLLRDGDLATLWGHYSCSTANCFWISLRSDLLEEFVGWALDQASVREQIALYQRNSFRLVKSPRRRVSVRPRTPKAQAQGKSRPGAPSHQLRFPLPATGKTIAPGQFVSRSELVHGVADWCQQHGVEYTTAKGRSGVTNAFIRYALKQHLIDPPGSPESGRQRGYTEKHACQLRLICLFESGSWSLGSIRAHLSGRPLAHLQRLERDQLRMHKGDYLDGGEKWERRGSPKWA